MALWMLPSPPRIASRKRSPDSVSVGLRVLCWNSRTPGLASSRATFLLTAAGVRPSRRAAAEKLPVSALRTKSTTSSQAARALGHSPLVNVIGSPAKGPPSGATRPSAKTALVTTAVIGDPSALSASQVAASGV